MSEDQTLSMEPVTNTENAESVTDLTNEEKKNHLLDINREHLIDKICIQEKMA